MRFNARQARESSHGLVVLYRPGRRWHHRLGGGRRGCVPCVALRVAVVPHSC